MAYLQIKRAGRALYNAPLEGRTVIGRSDGCDQALPGEEVSRIHCILEWRAQRWWVTDKSRHGTLLNGAPVTSSQLMDGDSLVIGTYEAVLWCGTEDSLLAPTGQARRWRGQPEELTAIVDNQAVVTRAVIRFTNGHRQGERVLLTKSVTTLGGPSADICLDEHVTVDAGSLHTVNGRVTLEAGALPMTRNGRLVRDDVPAWVGEEIQVGGHSFIVETATARETTEQNSFGDLVGDSPLSRRLFGLLQTVAISDNPVLLAGKPGTGKRTAARGIHQEGMNGAGPYVVVDCTGLSTAGFERELVGCAEGTPKSEGAFLRANGGTLVLEEVGDLEPAAQVVLLEIMRNAAVQRGDNLEHANVRMVFSTKKDLETMVQSGEYLPELYFHFGGFIIEMPRLVEHSDDVATMAIALLNRYHPETTLTQEALTKLNSYHWPGDARELRNVLTRAALNSTQVDTDALVFHTWSFSPPE